MPGRASRRSALQVHFLHCHIWGTLVILEEANHPLPRYTKCDMFVTWWALNRKHQTTVMCTRSEERRMKRLREEEAWMRI